MKTLPVIGVAAAGTAAVAAGWWSAAAPPAPVVAVRAGGTQAVEARTAPGPGDATALAMISAALPGPPGSQPAPVAAPLPVWRPPPPDPVALFRNELTAVVAERPGGTNYALLAQGEGPARLLRPGQIYVDRWKLARLSLDEAVFVRGRERRAVALFDPHRPSPPIPATASPAGAPAGGNLYDRATGGESTQPDAPAAAMTQNEPEL